MTKLKLSYSRHVMRQQGSKEKILMLGEIEGNKKGGRPHTRWIDSIAEARGMSLQELSGAAEDKT